MQVYLVGGAVRDELLGLTVKERDYVVVGATPEQILAKGFEPVGKDFPVFLHPQSKDEYALARTERKSGRGYKGFDCYAAPDVTLEQDLQRRDLTINAIACSQEGNLIDPYHGLADIRAKILRHVSPAFCEDPLRVLRVARFAARFHSLGFYIADETLALMQDMAASGELSDLTPERVWQEFSRSLTGPDAAVFLNTLHNIDALEPLLGLQLPDDINWPTLTALTEQLTEQKKEPSLAAAYAMWCWDLANVTEVSSLHKRLKVPNNCRDLAALVLLTGSASRNLQTAGDVLELLQRCDVWRRPERFLHACSLLQSTQVISRHTSNLLTRAWQQGSDIDIQQITAAGFQGAQISAELNQQRLAIIQELMQKS